MLDFTLSSEQEMLVEAVHRLAKERVRPVIRDADEEGQLPADLVKAGWELGILPSFIPEVYGGFGEEYSAVTGALVAEELAWGDVSFAMGLLASGAVGLPLLLAGSEPQRMSHLPAFCGSSLPRYSPALLEPSIRFDARNLETTAARDGDSFVLNGVKTVVPMADSVEFFLIYASEAGRTQAFLVPTSAEGLSLGKRNQLMGLRALPAFAINLTECAVPADNRLGGEEGINLELILNHSRVTMGAMAVGLARGAYEYAREYAKGRVQFGEPVAHRQSIAFMLAEMAIDVEAARLMVWEAAWLLDRGQEATAASAVMKHFVDEMAVRVADQALQILGGYGYIREYPVELWLRNARGFASLEGLAII